MVLNLPPPRRVGGRFMTYTPHDVFVLLAVATCFFAFIAGFHKGGQR